LKKTPARTYPRKRTKLEAHVERKPECARNIGGSRIANSAKNQFQQVLAQFAVLEATQMQPLPAAVHVCSVDR
jgi:hypothetical protein